MILRTSLGLPEGVPGIVMAIDTFGEYLDFHPHLHALVADGLFRVRGSSTSCPRAVSSPWRTSFRAPVITFLVDKGLLPPKRARMLRSWVYSGFNVHRGRRVTGGIPTRCAAGGPSRRNEQVQTEGDVLAGQVGCDPTRAKNQIRAILSEDLKIAKRVLSKEILRGCHTLKSCRCHCRFIRRRQHETRKGRFPSFAVP